MPDATLTDNIRWFSQLRNTDIALVGGKNASLGELYGLPPSEGVQIPNGFAIVAAVYREALTQAGAWQKLHKLLDDIDKTNVEQLAKRAAEARDLVYRATGAPQLRPRSVRLPGTQETVRRRCGGRRAQFGDG